VGTWLAEIHAVVLDLLDLFSRDPFRELATCWGRWRSNCYFAPFTIFTTGSVSPFQSGTAMHSTSM
jgi:hypothetical protein